MNSAVLLLLLAALADGYKILTYAPQFGQSHVFFVGSIADTLQEAGHNVTYLQTELVPNFRSRGAKAARVVLRPRDFPLNMSGILEPNEIWESTFGLRDTIDQFRSWAVLLSTSCYHLLKDDRLMDELQAERFDLLIGEHYDACTFGLVRRLGIRKYITAMAVPIYPEALRDLGHPTTRSYIPQYGSQHGQAMTYGQRVRALVDSIVGPLLADFTFALPMVAAVNRALDLNPRENIYEMAVGSSYYFVNSDEHLDFVQPLSPKVVHIGGLRMDKPKPLDPEFARILDSSVRGVVLVSFGSVALSSDMPNATKAEFVRFFSNFPDVTFVFKYERPADESMPEMQNVVLKSWVPQGDLLAHPKLLAFLTHAGQNSISEAAHRGCPALCIPLFADQQKNAQMAKQRGIALVLQRSEMTAERMGAELRRLIAPDSPFKRRARELGAMIEAKPFGARDRVVRFAEHAIRFDVAENLDLYARHLSTVEFYALDIWLPFGALFSLVLWVGWRFVCFLVRSLWNRRNEKAKVE
ncbi:UDP-glucuronosyltransferase [Aphelenchoides fujianensis]|nr:UDP-glucuronosyltransferase [Aphelenchoides fujianensis]